MQGNRYPRPVDVLQYEPGIRLVVFITAFLLLAGGEALVPRRARSVVRPWRWPTNLTLVALNTLMIRALLPVTAVGILLLRALARRGLLGTLLGDLGIEIVFTWKAVLLATMVMSFPLLVRSARTAFEEVDPRLVGIARTLGCGPARAFFRVTLPLAWRGILAGSVLAFSRALGEFGATIMVAGNIPGRTQTLPLAIFHYNQIGRDDRALALVGVTVVLAFVALWSAELVSRRRSGRTTA